ncbi:chromate transporter-domain-containing protein [Chytridium lagenaria]|nr:chromate transporter-domain-containing protein [Chytridium lagenaria]
MTTSTTTGDVERAISASAPTEERVLLERPFSERLKEVVINYLPLSWITFGGPQAHIALLFDLFVTRKKWLSEKMFAELFAMSNAMPGPASTQLAFTVALVRGGVACGIIAFLIWSVPGGLVMTFLGYGVGRLGAAGIPVWFKRVQNGLAAVAVSLVALAAFKLGSKILVDKLSVVMAIIAASIVINFLDVIWIIPTMMVLGGIVTTVEDNWEVIVKKIKGGKKEDGEDVNPASREIAEQVIVGSSSSLQL